MKSSNKIARRPGRGMGGAEGLVEEFRRLSTELGAPPQKMFAADGVIHFGKRGGSMGPDYFARWLMPRVVERIEATHDWWRPGQIDEVCRQCGAIRGVGRQGVCK